MNCKCKCHQEGKPEDVSCTECFYYAHRNPKPLTVSGQAHSTSSGREWEKEYDKIVDKWRPRLKATNGINLDFVLEVLELKTWFRLVLRDKLKSQRKELLNELIAWAENKVGKKCAKDDFLYQKIKSLE